VSIEGLASDGSRALFITTQQLVNADTDATSDLYACDIPAGTVAPTLPVNGCPNLRQVSASAAGGGDVENVVRVSDDGSRVYFVAHGVLAANHGASDQTAVAGAHNLYMWQADAEHVGGRTIFMARLAVNDMRIVDQNQDPGVEATADGRYLLVTTTTPLVTSGAAADTDNVADVYRYDAQTGEWLRISTNTTGSGGNAEIGVLYPSRLAKGNIRQRRSITDDGHTIVFQTDEALAPADVNNSADVYVWREGQVSLISPDGGNTPRITASGTDIFFTTEDHVTAADGDTNPDVYTARVGGGFDLREPAPCAGDACQGQPNATPAALALRSGAAADEGDVSNTKPMLVLKTITAAQRRSLAVTGKATLTVTAGVAGTVRARATATISGKTTSVSSARRTVTAPGAVTLAFTLSKQARAQLTARGKLTVRVVVAHSEVAAVRSVTLKLTKTQHKAKAKRAIKRSQAKRAASNVGGGHS
jgi:hypothetical protein